VPRGRLIAVEVGGHTKAVRPFRMEAEVLDHLPTRALTEGDRIGLRAWLEDPEAPGQALARAMLELDRKASQDWWFMVEAGGRGRHCEIE